MLRRNKEFDHTDMTLGKRLAVMERQIIIVALIRDYEFLSLPDELVGFRGQLHVALKWLQRRSCAKPS